MGFVDLFPFVNLKQSYEGYCCHAPWWSVKDFVTFGAPVMGTANTNWVKTFLSKLKVQTQP